jgi:hypothetical protein
MSNSRSRERNYGKTIQLDVNTITILIHQMHISTDKVSSVMAQAEKVGNSKKK